MLGQVRCLPIESIRVAEVSCYWVCPPDLAEISYRSRARRRARCCFSLDLTAGVIAGAGGSGEVLALLAGGRRGSITSTSTITSTIQRAGESRESENLALRWT
jgi:hypothetical protein